MSGTAVDGNHLFNGRGSTDPADLRQELRAWLEQNCPASMRTPMPADEVPNGGAQGPSPSNPDTFTWMRRAAERGLTLPTAPEAYGGAGFSEDQAAILADEMQRINARPPLLGSGALLLAPMLLRFGSEEQKRQHLPPIAQGEVRWCQGFSEPGAGSDLASLRMRAQPDGDEFVLNGQKTWTSFATVADWIFCLARTDPDAAVRQQGISLFLIDMRTPGITVRPIRLINGDTEFCETFFDDVRVPAANILGGENNGWTVAKALLLEERRATPGWTLAAWPFPLMDVWREQVGKSAAVAERVTDSELNRLALEATLRRAARLANAGSPEAERFVNVVKVWFAEYQQERGSLVTLLREWRGAGWAGAATQGDLDVTRAWLTSRALSIAGGSTEIQLNIISKHFLGLPTS
jgi:acyl-CoA dehydrogenase